MAGIKPIDILIISIEIILLYSVYQITFNYEIQNVIKWYQRQSYFLALSTGITAFFKMAEAKENIWFTLFLFFLVILLPLLLARLIEPLLVRATFDNDPKHPRNIRKQISSFLFPQPEQKAMAYRIWFAQKKKKPSFSSIFFIALVILGAAVAFVGIPPQEIEFSLPDRFGLFVSLALHLIGLYNTTAKGDIISQAIGLLTMDQGMYLAVVKIVAIPIPATFFVLSLYAYTIITMVILIYIMPQVVSASGSIDLDEVSEYQVPGQDPINLKG